EGRKGGRGEGGKGRRSEGWRGGFPRSAKALAERVQSDLRSERDDRRAGAPPGAKAGRKVRTPQGSAPVNGRSGRPEGKWHRKHTADVGRCFRVGVQAMVKRCGKSAPRRWQHRWQAKPRTEQDQIGRLERPVLTPPGRLL